MIVRKATVEDAALLSEVRKLQLIDEGIAPDCDIDAELEEQHSVEILLASHHVTGMITAGGRQKDGFQYGRTNIAVGVIDVVETFFAQLFGKSQQPFETFSFVKCVNFVYAFVYGKNSLHVASYDPLNACVGKFLFQAAHYAHALNDVADGTEAYD